MKGSSRLWTTPLKGKNCTHKGKCTFSEGLEWASEKAQQLTRHLAAKLLRVSVGIDGQDVIWIVRPVLSDRYTDICIVNYRKHFHKCAYFMLY